MNIPLDYIHDPLWSYGRLLFPLPYYKRDRWGKIRWLAYFKGKRPFGKPKGFRITDFNGFHNCRKYGS